MNKFKNALNTLGKVAEAYGERQRKVDEMTNQLMRRAYGVDADQARKIAAILVDRAEVTWK